MYSNKTKQIYIRRIFPHDLTHEVSVTTEIVEEFFEGRTRMTFFKGADRTTKKSVTINSATDPRFGGDFASMWTEDNLSVDDFIIIRKLSDSEYDLTTAKKGTPLHSYFNDILTGNNRHAVVSSEDGDENAQDVNLFSDNNTEERRMVEEIMMLLKENLNLVLTGAPGTGKTYLAKQMAAKLVGNCKWKDLDDSQKEHVSFVQFHPSYDYTDFVEGLRPDEQGNFVRTNGDFKDLCKKAAEDSDKNPYVMIIDEINRGEISKIFGELFYSIEKDYRGDETRVRTQYNNMVKDNDIFKSGFYVPENVYIIGTMNDIDRGVEAMDFAIRRRFAWREVTADESATNMGITGDALSKMKAINKAILKSELNEAYCIGGAYFRKVKDNDFEALWNFHLKGIVTEYFRGEPEISSKVGAIKEAYDNASMSADKQQDSNNSSEGQE